MKHNSGPLNPTPPDPLLRKRPTVKLVGKDGNAFAILSRVSQALRSSGYSTEEMDRYHREATSGDFNHLLQVTMAWVDDVGVEDEGEEDA